MLACVITSNNFRFYFIVHAALQVIKYLKVVRTR